MIDLGVVGIDDKLNNTIHPLSKKFESIKGRPGPIPKNYSPDIKSSRPPDFQDKDSITFEMDERSAFILKGVIESHKKKHNELKYFFYANLATSLWASFETYNTVLFEQIFKEKPEILKSSEQITIKEAIENKENIVDFLAERQLDIIGHFKLKEIVEYYKKRTGIDISNAHIRRLEKYYLLRNLIAHKNGLVREKQKIKVQEDLRIVGDEIRISKTFLLRMAATLDSTVRNIEVMAIKKYFPRK